MIDPNDNLDDAIETILDWRAARAMPEGLLEDIQAAVEAEPQRGTGFALRPHGLAPAGRLVWIGAAAALLAILAAGAALVGSRLDRRAAELPAVSSTPPAGESRGLGIVYCTKTRSLPFDAGRTDLTGAWSNRERLFFLREVGSEVWGVGTYPLGQLVSRMPLAPASWYALHGTVASDGTLTLAWSETGAVSPADATAGVGGSVVLRIDAAGGSTQLTTVTQSGYPLSGRAIEQPPFVFVPCTPSDTP